MSQPAALTKADALDRHLYGCSKVMASVSLCDREAWELLAWYQQSSIDYAPQAYQADFASELARARLFNNPWMMLEGFQIKGYPIARLPVEVH